MLRIKPALILPTIAISVLLILTSCNPDLNENSDSAGRTEPTEMAFDKSKWNIKAEGKYQYRNQMVNSIVYNDTIRQLTKKEIIDLLGEPDRINEDHFYYLISRKNLWFWTLHTKTMVVNFSNDTTVRWIKIHE